MYMSLIYVAINMYTNMQFKPPTDRVFVIHFCISMQCQKRPEKITFVERDRRNIEIGPLFTLGIYLRARKFLI